MRWAFPFVIVFFNSVAFIHNSYFSFINLQQSTIKTNLFLSRSAIIKQCRATLSAGTGSRLCWKCQGDVPADTEFCSSCKSLQPLDSHRNHFSILGIKMNFNIDTQALMRTFKRLQGQYHPDRYSTKSEVCFVTSDINIFRIIVFSLSFKTLLKIVILKLIHYDHIDACRSLNNM